MYWRRYSLSTKTAPLLIKEKKSELSIEQLRNIASFDEKSKAQEIIKLREEFQYGTETILAVDIVKKIIDEAKEIIETTKIDLKKFEL